MLYWLHCHYLVLIAVLRAWLKMFCNTVRMDEWYLVDLLLYICWSETEATNVFNFQILNPIIVFSHIRVPQIQL
jgi:hypothetical protein